MTDQLFCHIRVKSHLSDQWNDWFGRLKIENQPTGEALISGPLPDQAALYGLLNRMRDLGLALVSLHCLEPNSGTMPHPCQTDGQGENRGNDVRNPSQAK